MDPFFSAVAFMPKLAPAATTAAQPLEAPWRQALARRLLAWFRRHRRDLPWRRTREPYHVWVSEIMLQQTQVATVVPYYERFLAAFPTIESLAAADEHQVLRLWEGLGYYRRARGMHQAARVVVEQHGGQFPRAIEDIARLPGVGRYTAGAVASIAYDARAPILEANTVRLLSRLVALETDPTSSAGNKTLWRVAAEILPGRGCGDFNQALMELGSLVCTPKQPACEECCLADLCAARRAGRQHEIPRQRIRAASEAVREASIVVWRGDKVFLRKREHPERWAGLWDFPRFPLAAESADQVRREVAQQLRRTTGISVAGLRQFATLKHGVTRFRITLDCYVARTTGGRANRPRGECQWVVPADLDGLALSVTGRKLARLLQGAEARPTAQRS